MGQGDGGVLAVIEEAPKEVMRRAWMLPFGLLLPVISVLCIVLIGLFFRMPPAKTAATDGAAASAAACNFNVYKCGDIYLMGFIFALMIGNSLGSILSFAPLAMAQRWKMDPQAIPA